MIIRARDLTALVTPPDFRQFRDEDLDVVHRLVCRTIDRSYSAAYSPEAVAFFKSYHSRENIGADAGSGHTVIFHRDGRPVGTGTLLGTNIKRVFVLPEEQGKGIGSLIMAELERTAVGQRIGTIDLDSSTVSIDFYHRLGFVGDERRLINLENGGTLEYVPMTKKLIPD